LANNYKKGSTIRIVADKNSLDFKLKK